MAPPIPKFHVSELETQVNLQPSGKARKGPPIKLEECPLKEMVQYKCNISNPEKKKGDPPLIVCEPVVRFYRLCAGGLNVETTAWEGWREKSKGKVREGV